jgi:hypothetical protein
MKKYLITGALALVASATFISCLSDDDLGGSIIEQKIQAYQEVFEQEFGTIDPNQDWGFGSAELLSRTRAGMAQARTRGNAADGNEWGAPTNDPAEYDRGWVVPDTLTEAQKLRVTRYFQTHPYLTYVDPHWTNFFVQQVYTGGTNVLTGNESYKNKVYAPSPEVYRSGDKLPTQDADSTSDKLNYLFAYGETEHINNFNAATASYKPVLETGEDVNNGKKHNDQINLMYQSSTQEFSYQNAYSSVRHGIPYVALAGAKTIDEWADSVMNATGETIGEPVYYGTSYSGKPNSYWNRSFLGCDLELLIGNEIYSGNYYKSETYGETYKYLISNANQYGGDLRKYDNEPQGSELAWLLQNGYLPRESSADKDWIKPLPVADHYYSDWIVTLTEAKRQGEPITITIPVEPGGEASDKTKEMYYIKRSFDEAGSGRVFCEDLGVVRASDIDFNDIVFDVYIYKTEYITKHMIDLDDGNGWVLDTKNYTNPEEITSTDYDGDVWLLAGGGTIPVTITVAGQTFNLKNEFDKVWGQEPTITDKYIVNTIKNDEGRYGNLYRNINKAVKLNESPLSITSVADVHVNVQYGSQFYELVAYKGVAPHKICVPLGTEWLLEREEINLGYPSFTKYVKYQDKDGNPLSGYVNNPGVTYDGTVGGYVGDGHDYEFDEHANSVWETKNESSLYVLPEGFVYTPRHQESSDWNGEEVFIRENIVSGGGSGTGYKNDDTILVRRRH